MSDQREVAAVPRNILLVANWPSDTGYAWWLMETFWIAIAQKYSAGGRRILLCYPKIVTLNRRLTEAGIECMEFDFNFEKPSDLKRFLIENGVGCIYFSDRPYVSRAYAKIRDAGVHAILVHDHTPGDRTKPSGLKRLLKTAIARVGRYTADAYIACSKPVLRRFTEVACLPAEKCHLAVNGVDMKKFVSAATNIRSEIGLPPEQILVVSSGRATQYKGIHRIIDAAAVLRDRRPDLPVTFLHCGDGPDMQFFRERIASHGLGNRFQMLGMRNDVPDVLMSANIAVHASEGEGLSLAILEFMAAGLPAVVPNSPTVAQSIDDGRTGVLYAAGDSAGLAASLISLATDEPLRARLGKAARAEVLANYNLSSTVESVLQTFNGLDV